MDLPSVKGIRLGFESKDPSVQATRRLEAISRMNEWAMPLGVLSRDMVRFVVDDSGQVRCIANHFIPANKHVLHVPFKFDFSFTSLRMEIHPEKTWAGWNELTIILKSFEESYKRQYGGADQKDYFSKNLLLLVCIIGVLSKIDKQPNLSEHSEIVQAFSCYWHALPPEVGNVFCTWSEQELACLEGSSFVNCLGNVRRFGEQLYHLVFVPFITRYPSLFYIQGRVISMEEFLHVNSIVLSRSFSTASKKDRIALLPFVDLVNGKPNDLHNTTLENCAIQSTVNGEFYKYHILETVCDVYAGNEIFIEYAHVGNGDYLLAYNSIPLDPDVIMNNQKTEIFLDFSEFLETELLRKHPDAPSTRTLKRQHVYGCFNLPKQFPMSMEEFLSAGCSFTPSIRQVLIFLQFNESDAATAIRTSRIKSQLTPQQLHHLFHMFLRFIDTSVEKVNVPLLRAVVGGQVPADTLTCVHQSSPIPVTDNMRSAIFLHMSERLVIEVMINRFINLFPETFHELGYSIMRGHLVSNEINSILEELCAPIIALRQSHCMICGSLQNVSKCSRCRKAYYCSAGCQKEHWPHHKKVCKTTSALVPAAAAGAPPAPGCFTSALLYGGKLAGKEPMDPSKAT